jgi:hypothetical protein
MYNFPENISKIKLMRWAGHIARIREMRNAYRIIVRKPEKEELLGRRRYRR